METWSVVMWREDKQSREWRHEWGSPNSACLFSAKLSAILPIDSELYLSVVQKRFCLIIYLYSVTSSFVSAFIKKVNNKKFSQQFWTLHHKNFS